MPVSVESLFMRYGPMVHRRCARLLGDAAEAEDAMQDVFMRVLARRDRLVEDRIGALLWTMATQVSLNRLRRKRRKPEHGEGLLWQLAAAEDPERATLRALLVERIFAAEPAGMRIDTRTLAVLRWVDGMTWTEISAATGLSVAGVRKRLASLQRRAQGLEDAGYPARWAEKREST